MNTKTKRIIGISAWSLLAAILVVGIIFICSYEKPIAENVSEEGFLLNDDLVAIRENDGKITIKNEKTGTITAENISFAIAPRINAAGRMDNATAALRLVLTEDEEEATQLAHQLDDYNKARQKTEQEIVQGIVDKIKGIDVAGAWGEISGAGGSLSYDVSAQLGDYVSSAIDSNSPYALLGSLIEAVEDLASRAIVLDIDGTRFATATAGASDNVSGNRLNLKQRGLAL